MSNLFINIGSQYRETVEFSLVSKNHTFEIKSLKVIVIEAYPCSAAGVKIEALLIPNSYEVPLVPNYDKYELYPLTYENNSTWILKGNDIEKLSVTFEIPSMTAVLICVEVTADNIISNNIINIKTDPIFIEKNGEIADKGRKYHFENREMSTEFSIFLYKLFISKNLHYINVLLKEDLNSVIAEIIELLGIEQKELEDTQKLHNAFDFKYHPIIVERLFQIAEKIYNTNVKGSDDILLLRPSLWGIGVDLRQLHKKLSSILKNI